MLSFPEMTLLRADIKIFFSTCNVRALYNLDFKLTSHEWVLLNNKLKGKYTATVPEVPGPSNGMFYLLLDWITCNSRHCSQILKIIMRFDDFLSLNVFLSTSSVAER